MSDWPGGTSTPDILPSDMNELPSETQSYERLFNTMLDWPSEISTPDILHSDIIESLLETQSQERQVNTMFNCCSGTSTSPVLPLDTIETLSEIQTHERQDISQHIRQENANSTSGKITKKRSKVWQHFELYKDENGNDWAKCKSCGKVLNGSSKLGTTHLNNHLKSCKGKRNGGGGGDNLASNSSDTIAIKEKPVTDQQLNHLFLSPARMNITEESSKQVHDAGQARNTECGPSHSLRTIKLGPWPGGVLGGTAWDFKPIGNAAIKEIEINHGQVVDSVAFTSIDRTTRDIIATTRVGGNGGQPDQISLNWPEEYLTLINGTINDLSGYTVIESLTFHTNRKKHGPYGYTRGTPFEIPLENGEIVGFFGRAGLLLDAIGFYVVPSAD